MQKAKEKYLRETMVGFLRVSEGAALLTSRPCLLVMPLGVSVRALLVPQGLPRLPGPSSWLVSRGGKDNRLESGASATQGTKPSWGPSDWEPGPANSLEFLLQEQDQERGEAHQLLSPASGCYRTHPPQPPLLLPRLPVHQGGSKLPSSLKHQKL